MKRAEFFSRLLIITGILLMIGAPFYFWLGTPLIHASVAENGGWNPDTLQAEVGKPLHLKFTSDDVTHGFAVGQMNMEGIDILPGKVSDVTLTFDKPGIYTFFCTRWCGLNHWRMRGTIEVRGADSAPVHSANTPPLYVTLKLNIDAPHEAPSIPSQIPSAMREEQFINQSPITNLQSPDYYRAHSPYQVFSQLSNISLSETQRWDVVAYLWLSNTNKNALETGRQLYSQNCAACHGENGAGNGVFADRLKSAGESSAKNMAGSEAMKMQSPVDFTDAKRMLGASPALLQGKILRGGMGTGMPMWGDIFTEEQIWNLIAYLYSFQFDH